MSSLQGESEVELMKSRTRLTTRSGLFYQRNPGFVEKLIRDGGWKLLQMVGDLRQLPSSKFANLRISTSQIRR